MIARIVTEEKEILRTRELFAIAFQIPMERGKSREEEPEELLRWAAFDEDGSMMSTFCSNPFRVNFDGHSCRMGGIGGVATLPRYRRRGAIRACFDVCLRELYEKGYDFSYLYPFSTSFYRRFGYESCVQRLEMRIDLQLLKPRPVTGHFELCEGQPGMAQAVQEVEQVWEDRYNMYVRHTPDAYAWVESCDPAVQMEFTYVYFRADGTPAACVRFRSDKQILRCSRFWFADREGFDGLMNLFKSMAADHSCAVCYVPSDTRLQYLNPEWSLGAAVWQVSPYGMVRVVNVKHVLSLAKTRGKGSLCIRISDPQLSENNGTFRVTYGDGRVLSVEETEDAADVSMAITDFSALISGVCDGSAAAGWMDTLRLHNPQAPIDDLFFQKPLMIVDYF